MTTNSNDDIQTLLDRIRSIPADKLFDADAYYDDWKDLDSALDPSELAFERMERERPDPCDDLYDPKSEGFGIVSKVTDFLYLGDDEYTHDAQLQKHMKSLGITHVLDCRTEGEITRPWRRLVNRDANFSCFTNCTDDDFRPKSVDYFARAMRWAEEVVSQGGVLYVHCAMGINRGPSNGYAILRALDPNLTTAGALTLIRKARPFAAVAYWRDADDAIKEIFGR